jgi:D-xylose transport system ATP-binding protein
MNNSEQHPLIRVRNLSKHYGGVVANDCINVDIYKGEVLAIVGDNGAGKSTFINILAGASMPDGGSEIYFDGARVILKKPKDANKLGIYTVFQNLALCDNLNAYQNIFLGREISQGIRLVHSAMQRKTVNLFEEIGSNVPNPGAPVSTRSGGQRQAIAIAKAMLEPPRVILLDEPTAALGVIQRKQISVLIKRLRAEGRSVVLVTQDLQEVQKTADRALVFRLGNIAAELSGADLMQDNLVMHITGAVGV